MTQNLSGITITDTHHVTPSLTLEEEDFHLKFVSRGETVLTLNWKDQGRLLATLQKIVARREAAKAAFTDDDGIERTNLKVADLTDAQLDAVNKWHTVRGARCCEGFRPYCWASVRDTTARTK